MIPPKEGAPSGEKPVAKTTSPSKAKPTRTVANVRISSLLTEDVVMIVPAQEKPAILETLIKRVCDKKTLGDPAPYVRMVFEREKGPTTTVETGKEGARVGLSLPHERVEGLASFVAGMAVVPEGFKDPEWPDLTIRVMFLFFSPKGQGPQGAEAFQLHLRLLRSIASLFQPAFIENLAKAPSPAAVIELLRKAEK